MKSLFLRNAEKILKNTLSKAANCLAAVCFFLAAPLCGCVSATQNKSRETVAYNDAEFKESKPNGRNFSSDLCTISARGRVEHLFTHNLISHPEIAFAAGNSYGKNLDEDCLTPEEFRAILLQLYKNGYTLVNASDTFEWGNGTAKRTSFRFPEGRKPLILSFDDVVYARKNQGKGTSSRLDVQNGKIVAVTDFTGGESLVHGEEFAPILEDFIEKHPDFSFENARGIIFLTGFDGILGYRTDRNSTQQSTEVKKAAAVIAALKEKGWKFGCHSYAHKHMLKCTVAQVKEDLEKWKNEVQPLVGETPFYAYPYGEWTFGNNGEDERQIALENAGYSLFFGVGNLPFYTKMPLRSTVKKYLFMDRCPMDGVSLRNDSCARFFDCAAVYDKSRPLSHI